VNVRMTEELYKEICAMRKAGATVKKICEETGVSQHTVWKYTTQKNVILFCHFNHCSHFFYFNVKRFFAQNLNTCICKIYSTICVIRIWRAYNNHIYIAVFNNLFIIICNKRDIKFFRKFFSCFCISSMNKCNYFGTSVNLYCICVGISYHSATYKSHT